MHVGHENYFSVKVVIKPFYFVLISSNYYYCICITLFSFLVHFSSDCGTVLKHVVAVVAVNRTQNVTTTIA